MKKKRSSVSKLLDILKILKLENVDITNLKQTKMENNRQVYLRLIDIKQEGINIEEIIRKHGLAPDYKIGMAITQLRQACRGNKNYKITPEEKAEAEKMQIVKNKTVVTGLLDILTMLETEKIDVSKLQRSKKVNGQSVSTVLSDVVSSDIIEKYQLNPNYKIGIRIEGLVASYKGNNTYAITESQRARVESLKLAENKTCISELLDVLDILDDEGINIHKLKKTKTINGKTQSITLMDILPEDIIKKYALDPKYEIGRKLADLQYALQGKGQNAISHGDILRAKLLGIETGPRKSAISQTLDILEVLYIEGVNVYKIKQMKMEDGKLVSTTLADIEQDGIDIEAIIEKHRLDSEFKIGSRITKLRQAYAGKSANPITEDEKRRAEKIGAVKIVDMDAEQARLQKQLQEAEQLKRKALNQKNKKEEKV